MFRLLQALVAAVLAFFAYQYVSQHHRPTPARQTLTAVDSSDSKPPEAWKYGSPVQRQLYEDYWEKHPNGPAQRTDPLSEAESHMPSMASGETPDGLPTSSPPPMPRALSQRPDVVQLVHERAGTYQDLLIAIRLRDDRMAEQLHARIAAIDIKLNDLIRQSR